MASIGGLETETSMSSEPSTTVSSNNNNNESTRKIVRGLLYTERVQSFKDVWPYTKTTERCNPHEMAMAGLTFELSQPSLKAKCVVCYKVLENLSSNSDPWICHEERNPMCPLIKLGYPSKPDDYTMGQFLKLLEEAMCAELEDEYTRFDKSIRSNIEAVARKRFSNGDSGDSF